MTQELLVASTVRTEDFAALIKTYTPPPNMITLMLLESQPRHVVEQEERQDLLQFALFDANFDFTSYTSGRVFHEHGEIRWEKLHPYVNTRIVYTGNTEYKLDLQDAKERTLSCNGRVSRQYFLFGKRLDDGQLARIGPAAQQSDFAEVRIPRLLRYPRLPSVAKAERVQVAVYEYIDSNTGANIAYRFHNLVPFDPSQKSQEKNVV